MIPMSVDLPEPLGPMIPTDSPWWISRFRRSSAANSSRCGRRKESLEMIKSFSRWGRSCTRLKRLVRLIVRMTTGASGAI